MGRYRYGTPGGVHIIPFKWYAPFSNSMIFLSPPIAFVPAIQIPGVLLFVKLFQAQLMYCIPISVGSL